MQYTFIYVTSRIAKNQIYIQVLSALGRMHSHCSSQFVPSLGNAFKALTLEFGKSLGVSVRNGMTVIELDGLLNFVFVQKEHTVGQKSQETPCDN